MSSSNSMQTPTHATMKDDTTNTCADHPAPAWHAAGTPDDLPGWARELLDDQPAKAFRKEHHDLTEWSDGHVTHRRVVLHDARSMEGGEFTKRARDAYADLLDGIPKRDIFRIWNFIPGINARDESDQDRYMRFNAARFQAFEGQPDDEHPYPPASGVGHEGRDLVLHLLRGNVVVEAVDNPRQILPERYSETWGKLPPVFIRSALVSGVLEDRMLIISGTASVRGEETMHVDDLDAQLDETIRNIEELLRATTEGDDDPKLDSMLIYVPKAEHLDHLRKRIMNELAGPSTTAEFRVAQLCRDKLLVEIEGTMVVKAGTS